MDIDEDGSESRQELLEEFERRKRVSAEWHETVVSVEEQLYTRGRFHKATWPYEQLCGLPVTANSDYSV